MKEKRKNNAKKTNFPETCKRGWDQRWEGRTNRRLEVEVIFYKKKMF